MSRIISLTFLYFFISNTAYAYIDPGSGSVIISAIIGFFVTAGVFIKSYYYKIKSYFNKKAKKD